MQWSPKHVLNIHYIFQIKKKIADFFIFRPDWFSRFYVYWTQTDKQANYKHVTYKG